MTDTQSPRRNPHTLPTASANGEGKKARFTEIGVAFPHKDGKGFDILYDAIPLAGRITLRLNEAKK